ncbi:MAG: sortase B protein-sorting domain-containing protein [Lachnospiraceae bacterium]|nr:sortase B protein-sorting domain-containing protein [Lachnospiraceae bacterium]HCI24586.1 hypothetical protein [Lachnospiraceae bacterium]
MIKEINLYSSIILASAFYLVKFFS